MGLKLLDVLIGLDIQTLSTYTVWDEGAHHPLSHAGTIERQNGTLLYIVSYEKGVAGAQGLVEVDCDGREVGGYSRMMIRRVDTT